MEIKREKINFLGAKHTETASNMQPHAHDFFELNFMTRGSTRMKLNEKVIKYDSYDFLLIPPHTNHILHESDYGVYDNYVIWFEEAFQTSLMENKVIKLHDYDGEVQFLCAKIYQTHMKTGMKDRELLNIYLEAVLWHMKKGLILDTDQAARNDEDMVDEAIKFINVNVKNARISVKMIADMLHVSEEHFSRLFKKKIGVAPVKYINEVKIAEAKRMLAKTNISIKDISVQIYYSDPFYFSQQFKKLTGYSPSEYRNSSLK